MPTSETAATTTAAAATQQKEENGLVERIYIGGMDPDCLTIQQVLERIPQDRVLIQSISKPAVHPRYCHISAVAKTKTTTPKTTPTATAAESTALEIIQKLLHNVKWKGCKLTVQAAQPHFLQRLRVEQQQRQQQRQIANHHHRPTNPPIDNATTTISTLHRRRYFRIRHKYGEPAWLVDTKPYQVDDANMFDKMVQHVRKKEKNNKNNNNSNNNKHDKANNNNNNNNKKKPYRAVHLTFDAINPHDDDDDDDDHKDNKKLDHIAAHDENWLSEASSSSSSSLVLSLSSCNSTTKTTSSSLESFQNVAINNDNDYNGSSRNKRTYVWSDDESSQGADQNVPKNNNSSPDHDDDDDDKFILSTTGTRSDPPQDETKNGKYTWSDDDDDDDNGDNGDNDDYGNHRSLVRRPVHGATNGEMDEFASALDREKQDDSKNNKTKNEDGGGRYNDDNDSGMYHKADMKDEDTTASDINLEQDEARNLKILATLFPEIATKPEIPKYKQDGWNAMTMMRYDPTKTTSKQLLEHKSLANETDSSSSGSSSASSSLLENVHKDRFGSVDDQESDLQEKYDNKEEETLQANMDKTDANKEAKIAPTEPDQGDVYRQDDLETVFREAREFQTNRAPVIVQHETETHTATGSFAFGFSLKQEPPAEESASFSFGFDVSKDSEIHRDPLPDETVMQDVEKEVPRNRKRRKLHSYSKNLDAYVHAYLFELNEGARIANDLKSFRSDTRVQEAWDRQRQRLTTDWKSKRKRAMARKQKRHHT